MKATTLIIFALITMSAQAQVPVWKLPDLENYCKDNDSLLVINFWASWCKPCIKELPYFEEARSEFSNRPVKFLLVSLDFKRELETKVIPFVKARNMQSPVVLLDEPDYNSWIDKVEPSWSGAIPGTLFIAPGGKRKFVEKEFEKEELLKSINEMLDAR